MLGLLKAIFLSLAGWLGWKVSPAGQRAADRADAAAEESDIQAGQKAVTKGDEDEVNRRLKRLRLGLCLIAGAALALGTDGCLSPRVVYVPESEKAVRVRAGQVVTVAVDGWLVPDGTFALLLEKAERWNASRQPGHVEGVKP